MPKGSWKEFDNTSKRVQVEKAQSDKSVRVQKTRAGKAGKTVTVVTGMNLNDLDSKHLLKRLKIHCGTGGTVKGGIIELQGDHINSVMEVLRKDGFSPKRAGG